MFERAAKRDSLIYFWARNLLPIIEPSTFKSTGVVILNPGFGLASALVGGADADLLIDDLLIDNQDGERRFSLPGIL